VLLAGCRCTRDRRPGSRSSYETLGIVLAGAIVRIGLRSRAMIKKLKNGYKVLSEKGKNLGGPYKTKAAAEKRLQQVEYFKHSKG
jgi:hypothetical protein